MHSNRHRIDHDEVPGDLYESSFVTSEAAMQAAGRNPSQSYRDLRSARRSYQRTRNYTPKSLRARRQCCRRASTSSSQARRARERSQPDYMLDGYSEVHADTVKRWHEDRQRENICACFRGLEQTEDFGTWARRRVSEMRAAKEARSQSTPSHDQTTTLPTTQRDVYAHQRDVYAHQRDVYAHTVLNTVLVPNAAFIHFLSPSLVHVCGIWRFWGNNNQYFDSMSGRWQWDWVFCERCMYKKCVRGCRPFMCCQCKGDDEVGVARNSGRAALEEWRWREMRTVRAVGGVHGKEMVGDEEWDLVSNVSEDWSVVGEETDFEAL